MAELTFTLQNDGFYTAEFKAEGDFALHIERNQPDTIMMLQKSMENANYAVVDDSLGNGLVIDADIRGFIAPKWIQLKTRTQPTYAAINA